MKPQHWSPRRIAMLAARLLISAVVAFWVWFLLADGGGHIWAGEQPMETLKWMITFGVPLLAIGVTAWKWPRVGGVLAMLGGVAAGIYFGHPAPRLLMALPLIVGGVTLLAATWRSTAGTSPTPTAA